MFCFARCHFRKCAYSVQTSQKHLRFFWCLTLPKNTKFYISLVIVLTFVTISRVYVSDWQILVVWIIPMKMWSGWYNFVLWVKTLLVSTN